MIDARELERVTRDAWPAAEAVPLASWVLRAHHGVTRRANSVWTAAQEPKAWQRTVEDFYRSRGLPVRLQVGDASPDGLDERLAAAGYVAEAPTSVLTVPCADLLSRTLSASGLAAGDTQARLTVSPKLTAQWLDAYLALEGIEPTRRSAYEKIVGRVHGSYAMVSDGRAPAAVALGTYEDGWLGVSCLVTGTTHRGQGLARTLVRALAERRPQAVAWLQVTDSNGPGLRLYERLGFTRAYGYHYRVLDAGDLTTAGLSRERAGEPRPHRPRSARHAPASKA